MVVEDVLEIDVSSQAFPFVPIVVAGHDKYLRQLGLFRWVDMSQQLFFQEIPRWH